MIGLWSAMYDVTVSSRMSAQACLRQHESSEFDKGRGGDKTLLPTQRRNVVSFETNWHACLVDHVSCHTQHAYLDTPVAFTCAIVMVR